MFHRLKRAKLTNEVPFVSSYVLHAPMELCTLLQEEAVGIASVTGKLIPVTDAIPTASS